MNKDEHFKVILNEIKKQEGGYLHYNVKTEEDITTGYGIYRKAHPNASIFKWIDELAKKLNINGSSKIWGKDPKNLKAIQKAMDEDGKEVELTVEFYKEYFKPVSLLEIPPRLWGVITSIYTNSPGYVCPRAIQLTVNEFIDLGIIKYKKLTVDAKLGPNTRNGLLATNNLSSNDVELFRTAFIKNAKLSYDRLCEVNPKLAIYKKGWHHRCDSLIRSNI